MTTWNREFPNSDQWSVESNALPRITEDGILRITEDGRFFRVIEYVSMVWGRKFDSSAGWSNAANALTDWIKETNNSTVWS